jgi:hypothetical protein
VTAPVSALAVQARRNFDAQDMTIASLVAILAQLCFVALFSLPPPKLVQADLTDDNAKPIAVAITPVLKLGTKTPGKLPSKWQRRQPVAAKTQPQAALPSTQAEKTPEAIPRTSVPDASVVPLAVDSGHPEPANPTAPADSAVSAAAPSSEGSELGATNGTETDPLKGRAADMYRAQLASWFIARFQIRGKIPFDILKTLHAVAVISVADRTVTSFTIARPSNNDTFDGEVRATLTRIQQSGTELPGPPPMYPDFLRQSLTVDFKCNVQKGCE